MTGSNKELDAASDDWVRARAEVRKARETLSKAIGWEDHMLGKLTILKEKYARDSKRAFLN